MKSYCVETYQRLKAEGNSHTFSMLMAEINWSALASCHQQ